MLVSCHPWSILQNIKVVLEAVGRRPLEVPDWLPDRSAVCFLAKYLGYDFGKLKVMAIYKLVINGIIPSINGVLRTCNW